MADITGLTPSQKDAIRQSWAQFSTDMTAHGVALSMKVAEVYPEYMDLFPDFRGKSLDELRTSYHVRAHSTTILFNLASMIHSLDDSECLARMIRKLGSNHVQKEVSMEHFQNFGRLFFETFEESLGDGFTDEIKEAWMQFYTVLMSLVGEEINKAKVS